MFPTDLDVGREAVPIRAASTLQTRPRAVRCAPAALLVTLAVLLAACSAETSASGSESAGSLDRSGPTRTAEPERSDGVFDPDEPTLAGGVRVLSQDVDGHDHQASRDHRRWRGRKVRQGARPRRRRGLGLPGGVGGHHLQDPQR